MSARSIEKAAIAAVKMALRPVMRLCLRRSIKLMEIFELAKQVLVEIAQEELARSGSDSSVSKISVMSGVHRRDVTRLLHPKNEAVRPESVVSKVIGQWQNDKRFIDKNGAPRVLKTKGVKSDLFKLVRSVSSDLAPYTILFELERLGLVECQNGSARLVRRLHLAKDDLSAGYAMFGEDLRDLGEAIDRNLHSGKPDSAESKNLHLKTEFSAIPRDKIPEISRWLLVAGSKFHHRVERYLAKFDRDITNQKAGKDDVRVAYGSFCLADYASEGKNQ